jgi:hypothetical protein
LNEGNDQVVRAADLSPERKPLRRGDLARRRCHLSVHRHHHLDKVSHKAGSLRPQDLGRLGARQMLQSKLAVKPPGRSAVGQRRQPALVHVNAAAVPSKDNLARHLLVQGLAKREAEESEANRESIGL